MGAFGHEADTVSPMDITVLTGDDDLAIRSRRDQVLKDAGLGDATAERVDVALDRGEALLDAVGSPSLFGGRRFVRVDNIDQIGDVELRLLQEAAKTSDTVVVAQAGAALTAPLRAALKALGTVVSLGLPRGRGVGMRVEEMLRESGVRFGHAETKLMVERSGHDLDRLNSILKQLKMADMTTPSTSQLLLLLGSTSTPEVPWDLSDAVEGGDFPAALSSASGLEPIPALAYLMSRVSQMGRLVDAGCYDSNGAADLLKLSHKFQADKLVRGSKTLGPEGVRRAWDVLVAGDASVKHSREPKVAFDRVVVDLTRCFTG